MSGWTSWCLLWGSLFLISVSIGTGEQHPTILVHFLDVFHEDRSSVTVGDTILFRCHWSDGNPQRRILLLGPDNSTLKEVDVTDGRHTLMWHDIKNISCSDGGQYRCQVEGTEEVKSLTVLVRCPLTFKEPAVPPTKHVVSGEDATFSFRATSYTHNVRSCQLKKPDDTTIGCNSSSSVVTVTGQLPDVDVIVTLKDFTERDEGTWQLTVSNPTPSQKPATARFRVFIANYPTRLEQFHAFGHKDRSSVTVNKGDTIQFNCQWSEGNPQRRILLLGPGNNTLKEVDVTDGRRSYTRHDMKIISCSDGGQYRCQVEGTEEVKSLTVLVRCPLVFKKSTLTPAQKVTTGTNARFFFSVTSYTTDVTSCQLKHPDEESTSCNSSRSDVIVTGPLPDVDVIVTLKDVTERDEGMWQLTVSNPTPSQEPARARFHLFVTKHPDRSYLWYFWYAIGGGAVLLAIIIMISVIIIVRKCKNRRKLTRTTEAGGAVRRAVPLASSDDDYLEPVARRVESAGTAGDDHRAVPAASSDDCQEPVARRVESSAHEYVEVIPDSPTRLRPPHRVLPPVPLEGPYESLILDEVGQRSVYSRLGN
ncbi:uncharacterized protein LOC143291621 isoform X2 [Babylonia areolata]|uniref:uncharacterized protein LOC143291621 isoform X2 n=1 Tax=Babylonia areolata TaxID=304850 RepID=UPI003FCFA9AE